MLIKMSPWIYLMLLAISIAALFFLLLKPKRKDIIRALKLGLLLVVIDFVFEHFGVFANLWSIYGSIFFLGVVPAEVVVIAFCAGFTHSLLIKPKFDALFATVSSLLIGLVGIGIEALLIAQGVLVYLGVTSWHALLAYTVTFIALHKVNAML